MRIKSNAMEIYISLGVQRTNYSCIVASLEKGMQESEREVYRRNRVSANDLQCSASSSSWFSLCLNQFGAARLFSKLHRRRICRERERERIQFGNLCSCSGWQRETNRINKTKENEEFFYTLLVILYPPAQF